MQAKLIAIALGALFLTGAGGVAYIGYLKYEAEKTAVDTANAALAVEKANTLAAQKQANGLQAAMNSQKTAQEAASANRKAVMQSVASAVAASPAVASTVVPESYWKAIYGGSASEAK